MFDKLKVKLKYSPPELFFNVVGGSVVYNNVIYNPGYNAQGEHIRYDAKVKNLLLRIYPEYAIVTNSIHKFYHGTNSNDFSLSNAIHAFEILNEITGIDWSQGTVYSLEYGANILAQIGSFKAMLSYKGKDYQPMVSSGGKPYGAKCCFEDSYDLKYYDKKFEAWQTDKIRVSDQLYRWEVAAKPPLLKRLFGNLPSVKDLLTENSFAILKNDALNKFNSTIRQGQLNLTGLSTAETKILAAMQNPVIKEHLKNHHKATFKRDSAIYRKLMSSTTVIGNDQTGTLLSQKFDQLISANQPCSIAQNMGNILTSPLNNNTMPRKLIKVKEEVINKKEIKDPDLKKLINSDKVDQANTSADHLKSVMRKLLSKKMAS